MCLRENYSFAPLGLIGCHFYPRLMPWACILTPLRGFRLTVLFHRVGNIPVLTQILKGLLQPTLVFGRLPRLAGTLPSRGFFLSCCCFHSREFEFVLLHIHATASKHYAFGFQAQALFDGRVST